MVNPKFEIHFFHGFLGEPSDWDSVLNFIPDTWKSVKIYKHDLSKDCERIESLTFETWAHAIEGEWGSVLSPQFSETPQRILVGYSLGGRLCLHIKPEFYCHLFLIAAHPGLKTGLVERAEQDQIWAESLLTEDPEVWLERWNRQLVFSQDLLRPKRCLKERQFFWSQVLMGFSLSRQKNLANKILTHKNKIHWLVGEKDLNYQNLKKSMQILLGENHVVEITDAGHGVLFDQPELLSKAIFERCSDVV